MLISRKISDYLVFETEPVLKALEKVNLNQSRVVFIVGENGLLLGSLSDGDFRRWVTANPAFNLNEETISICNKNVRSCPIDSPRSEIDGRFGAGIDIVPLVDSLGRLVSVALRDRSGISINGVDISETSPAFIIAEIGNNHNGSMARALELVDLAIGAGADCVKFQMRCLDELYAEKQSVDLGAEYTLDLLRRFQLSNSQLFEVFDYVKAKGKTPLCTPWDLPSLRLLEEYGMPAYKVASADFTNYDLLEALVATGKPLICSTGMSTEVEVLSGVRFLQERGASFVLLHCNSTYPAPLKDINLDYIEHLRKISDGIVGYSGHERGIAVCLAAVTLGAKIIEKHFTTDRALEGNDHKVSLLPSEFAQMVEMIREIETAKGKSEKRKLTQGELLNRETLAKSLVARIDIKEGETITREMLDVRSPGQGLQPMYVNKLLGKPCLRPMRAGDFFFASDLEMQYFKPRKYKFKRSFGIPVRYHDFEQLYTLSNFDFVEFHLSYKDMEIPVEKVFKESYEIGFSVHSPELFSGDHVMNLASEDLDYRNRSVFELNRVCDITRTLKSRFPSTEVPLVIINAGGFSEFGFLDQRAKPAMYERVADSLREVNSEGVEIIIQTMPPYPWHFGGQRYHNIFVDPNEIQDFCQKVGVRICFDVSHSMMACNKYGWEFKEFTKKVAPLSAHLHVVDAFGVDGEGVQIGKGDVDFKSLSSMLLDCAPNIGFIPEIWQGHKNNGEGFWEALDFLEQYF